MLVVLAGGSTRHKYVIDIREDEMKAAAYLMDKPLECLSCIPEAEGHSQKFKQPKRGGYCCFWDVRGVNRNLVISLHEVYLAVDGSSSKVLGEVLYVW